ncbi:GNAT family N-acetyltransferase [Flavobacteriaceae bacterium]|nr:GNAT family N-acetyltransferase [Flavobacteriaceae bacterium]
MVITNSNLNDISEIFRLYDLATNFQKIKFPKNQWPLFNKNNIAIEIIQNRQFKLIIDGKIACIWGITYSDPQIWEEKENALSIYIHRIATNPEYRGNNFVKTIVNWAKDHALQHHKQFIRMDTCGRNERLISYYKGCGFNFLGINKLQNTTQLPSHYHNAEVCFFEIKL